MSIIDRVKEVLMAPAPSWEKIKNEDLSVAAMFKDYAVYLAAIMPVAGFIGKSFVGFSIYGSVYSHMFRMPVGRGIAWAILTYIMSLVSVYILAMIIDALAPSFGAKKNINDSTKVAVFSMTAVWVAGIFQIIPVLAGLSVVGLYSAYLMYLGLKIVKETPQDKLIGYVIVTVIIALVMFIVLASIVGMITMAGLEY